MCFIHYTTQFSSDSNQGSDVPTVSGGVLWPDQANKLFYLFGGVYNNGRVQDFTTLWSYDTIYNTWNKTIPDGSQMEISWPSFGASTVTDENVAYYYGGYLSNNSVTGWTSDPLMLNSLVSYDMKTNKWDNRTYDVTPRAQGNLHYIPASDRGMLVYFGGMEQSKSGTTSYVSLLKL
jgi:N-acetylneuraminic acid mutarotase